MKKAPVRGGYKSLHVGGGTQEAFATRSKMSPVLSLSMSIPSSRASMRNFSIIKGGSNIDSSGSQLDSERSYLKFHSYKKNAKN